MIDVPLTAGGSDSQDLNRTLETLLVQYGYSLFEAMEIYSHQLLMKLNFMKHLYKIYIRIYVKHGDILHKDQLASFPVLKMKLFSALIPLDYAQYGK